MWFDDRKWVGSSWYFTMMMIIIIIRTLIKNHHPPSPNVERSTFNEAPALGAVAKGQWCLKWLPLKWDVPCKRQRNQRVNPASRFTVGKSGLGLWAILVQGGPVV